MTLAHSAPAAGIEPSSPAPAALPELQVQYCPSSGSDPTALLNDPQVLAVIGFGDAAPASHPDSRYFRVSLEPVQAPAPFEVWRSRRTVISTRLDDLRVASDGDYAFGVIEVAESAHGGIEGAATAAYRALVDWLGACATPHVLRMWNYLDAINLGDGDDERYRRFCSGRAAGMRGGFNDGYPAATAIGVRDGRRALQIYWLASREPGLVVENPRQISAWRYPRQYGPQAPGFARAMRAPTRSAQVYISGTAAIIGHASHHHDDFAAQIDETFANIDSVLAAAQVNSAARFGAHSALKAYVRRDEDAPIARSLIENRLPAQTPVLLLRGDVCRRELLIEIDGVQVG